jgi:hypothetical protein
MSVELENVANRLYGKVKPVPIRILGTADQIQRAHNSATPILIEAGINSAFHEKIHPVVRAENVVGFVTLGSYHPSTRHIETNEMEPEHVDGMLWLEGKANQFDFQLVGNFPAEPVAVAVERN